MNLQTVVATAGMGAMLLCAQQAPAQNRNYDRNQEKQMEQRNKFDNKHENRQQKQEQGHFNGDGGHHTDMEARSHFNGRNFDTEYRGNNFGQNHQFRMTNRVRFGNGYRFYYGGLWYDYNSYPYGWSISDPVYIDQEGDGEYFLYNPYHEGRISVSVVL
jgi:Ni/Co efflux regulator RcnB